MSIQHWPEHDRPREKLLRHGADHLTDSELLALLIQSGTADKSSVDCARGLIDTFGNLRSVMDATRKDLCHQPGIGPAKYALIQASAAMGRRFFQQDPVFKGAITSVETSKNYFRYRLAGKKTERLGICYLNASYDILAYDEAFHGSINQLFIHYRECIKRALNLEATSMIIAHNHPNGLATPSQTDIDTTERLMQALKLVSISLIDHIIVGKSDTFSMRDAGLLAPHKHILL